MKVQILIQFQRQEFLHLQKDNAMDKFTKNNKVTFEELCTLNKLPHSDNVYRINTQTFPMGNNLFFTHNPVALAVAEWERFKDVEFNPLAMYSLHNNLPNRERGNLTKLIAVAEKIVREKFDLPNSIKFEIEIGDAMELDSTDGPTEDEIEEGTIQMLSMHIAQRQIINCITHGASVFLTDKIFFIEKELIDEIDPTLVKSYKEYTNQINLSNWHLGESMLGGSIKDSIPKETIPMINPSRVEVVKADSGWVIRAKAPNIPILLHELVKGCLELLSYWAIPATNNNLSTAERMEIPINRDLTHEELKKVYRIADAYRDERWYYYMGPSVWRRLIEHYNVLPDQVPRKLQELYSLPTAKFLNTIDKIVFE
jgi:hypothetical protein